MSKEIDFSKAPEWATQVRSNGVVGQLLCWSNGSAYQYFDGGVVRDYGAIGALNLQDSSLVVDIPDKWTIHNNTKPLKDLTDEQAAELFNAWRSGATVELVCDEDILNVRKPDWSDDVVYRIKPKSERELFVEACIQHAINPEHQKPIDLFEALFEAGCRFKD